MCIGIYHCDAARDAFKENLDIDCGPNSQQLGSYQFPASWLGDLWLPRFIEMIMHLLFLGVAGSTFKLCNSHIKSIGKGEETSEKNVQEPLKALTKFNLSWPLILPLSG